MSSKKTKKKPLRTTLSFPNRSVLETAKRRAKQEHRSVSNYVTMLILNDSKP